MQQEENKEIAVAINAFTKLMIGMWIFAIVWGVIGLIGFVMSIVCFWKSGTTTQHVLGLVLALLLGPFYWLYYGLVKSYCASKI